MFMVINWDPAKDKLLKETRGISFEQVEAEINAGHYVGPEINPAKGRGHQKRVVVKINGYPYAVPFVIMENGGWFLKTAYPSRKDKERI